VDPRASLAKEKILAPPGLKLRPLGRPARSQSVYSLTRGSISSTAPSGFSYHRIWLMHLKLYLHIYKTSVTPTENSLEGLATCYANFRTKTTPSFSHTIFNRMISQGRYITPSPRNNTHYKQSIVNRLLL
jgi:hypothetical protein